MDSWARWRCFIVPEREFVILKRAEEKLKRAHSPQFQPEAFPLVEFGGMTITHSAKGLKVTDQTLGVWGMMPGERARRANSGKLRVINRFLGVAVAALITFSTAGCAQSNQNRSCAAAHIQMTAINTQWQFSLRTMNGEPEFAMATFKSNAEALSAEALRALDPHVKKALREEAAAFLGFAIAITAHLASPTIATQSAVTAAQDKVEAGIAQMHRICG